VQCAARIVALCYWINWSAVNTNHVIRDIDAQNWELKLLVDS